MPIIGLSVIKYHRYSLYLESGKFLGNNYVQKSKGDLVRSNVVEEALSYGLIRSTHPQCPVLRSYTTSKIICNLPYIFFLFFSFSLVFGKMIDSGNREWKKAQQPSGILLAPLCAMALRDGGEDGLRP